MLLVRPYFMASEFIANHELPQLRAATRDGLLVLPVIVSPYVMGELASYQSVNPSSRPLVDVDRGDRDRVWVEVVEAVMAALND